MHWLDCMDRGHWMDWTLVGHDALDRLDGFEGLWGWMDWMEDELLHSTHWMVWMD